MADNMHHRNATQPNVRTRAFTLMELVVSVAIMTLLFGGMISSILIASHALPDGRNTADALVLGSDALAELANDLFYASAVTESTATAITFTVPDRGHGAAGPETIRYEWSGTPGDPLFREYNGGAKVAVVDGVHDFVLTYDTVASDVPKIQPTDVEGPEQVFLRQDSTNAGSATIYTITAATKCGEYFTPSLPADATSWRITRIKFMGAPSISGVNDPSSVLVVALRPSPPLAGLLTSGTIETVEVPESSLVPGQWHEVTFAAAGGLSPSQGCFITFGGKGGGTIAKITVGMNSTTSPDTRYFTSGFLGTWSENATRDVWLWVFGTVTGPDPGAQTPTVKQLHCVNIALELGSDAVTRAETAALTVNHPDLIGP